MPTVSSNSAAAFAMNNITKSERDMTSAMERLSSGKRINHAGDDAAGAAIADRMTAQIRGLEQSVRNAADVISMAQVTEGALDESSSILQRIRELAIQSASDVMNAEERAYLNEEVIQMLAELDRVTRDTTFNEIAVLDGSFADRRFQIGTHEREFATLSISSMRLDALGAYKATSDTVDTDSSGNLALNAYAVADTTSANLIQNETMTIHGILGSSAVSVTAGQNVRDVATSVNAVFNSTGVAAISSSQLKMEAKTLNLNYNGQNSVSFSIEGKNATAVTISANVTLNNSKGSSVLSGLRDAINNYTTTTGVTSTLSSDKSSIILVQNEGYDIKIGNMNFESDTSATGARRVMLVTSLDNDEATAGNAVMLGDTNVTSTSTTSIVAAASGTASTAMTLNASGIASATTDPNGIVSSTDISGAGAYTLDGTLASGASINSFVTITNGDTVNNSTHTFTVTGTDVYGVAQTETITGVNGNAAVATGSKIFKTITGVSTDNNSGIVEIGTKNAVVNQSALMTITSAGSDESGKTFTIVGTDMDGTVQNETIVGPAASATVTGRKIFKTVHSVTPSANTSGNISVGVKAADSAIVTGQLELSSSNTFTVSGEDGKGLFELSPGAASLDKLETVNVKTRKSSVDALRVLDRSLDRIHKERAKLGALMSRMEKAIDNLSNVALNTKASRGRIEDADFAIESARLTKSQILQQSAMAMIAQAGKAQQNVLQLLQQ